MTTTPTLDAPDITDPTDTKTIAVLRAAAAKVRTTAQEVNGTSSTWDPIAGKAGSASAYEHVALWSPTTALGVADWLDGEAAMLSQLDPFVSLIDAVISSQGKATARLSHGRTPDNAIEMHGDTTPAAVTLAHLILGPKAVAAAIAKAAVS